MNQGFTSDHRGSVSAVFALAAVTLLVSVGMAVDYGRTSSLKTKLQLAADAAALAATSDPYITTAQATAIAQSYLGANKSNISSQVALAASVNRTESGVSVTVKAALPMTFMRLGGFAEVPVAATSTASSETGEFEVYAAVDMSASLGIAATPQARADLEALTKPYTSVGTWDAPNGCHFACHFRDGWEPAGVTTYDMAKVAGIPLREDVLNAAFGELVDAFMPPNDPAVLANNKRMAVIGFSDRAQLLAGATNDPASVKNAPLTFPADKRLNTDFSSSISDILGIMGTQGSGFKGAPRKTLLLVTDGVSWNRWSGTSVGNGAIDMSLCDSVKSKGFSIAVLEVKYVATPGDPNYDWYVAPVYPTVSPALQACASPGLYLDSRRCLRSSRQSFAHAVEAHAVNWLAYRA